MGSDNKPNKRWLIPIPLVLLMMIVLVVTNQRQRQELHEARRIERIREYPYSHVKKGMDVALVERALGPGERFEIRGEDVRVWLVPGKPFVTGTIVATIRDGKVHRTSMTPHASVFNRTESRLTEWAVQSHTGSHTQSPPPRFRWADQPTLPQEPKPEQEKANDKPAQNEPATKE